MGLRDFPPALILPCPQMTQIGKGTAIVKSIRTNDLELFGSNDMDPEGERKQRNKLKLRKQYKICEKLRLQNNFRKIFEILTSYCALLLYDTCANDHVMVFWSPFSFHIVLVPVALASHSSSCPM